MQQASEQAALKIHYEKGDQSGQSLQLAPKEWESFLPAFHLRMGLEDLEEIDQQSSKLAGFFLFYFILFYFIFFYFILFYLFFILFYFILLFVLFLFLGLEDLEEIDQQSSKFSIYFIFILFYFLFCFVFILFCFVFLFFSLFIY